MLSTLRASAPDRESQSIPSMHPPHTGFGPKPRHFELRMALIYAATIGANGIFLPFFPVWLESLRLDPTDIAFILAAPMFLRVFATLAISSYADRSSDRAGLLIASIASTLLLSLLYLLPPSYALLLGVSLALAFTWPVQATLSDSITLSGVRRYGVDYSSTRIWGSIAYLVANFGGGVVLDAVGAGSVPVMFALAMAAALVFALFTPRLGAPRARMRPDAPATPLLRQPFFVLFVLASGLLHASHAFFYGFSAIYWKSLGISDTLIGALWAFAVVAEVAVFAAFTRVFGRLGTLRILYAAGAAAVVRWLLTPAIAPLGFGLAGFFVVQALHGISIGLLLIGIQKMIAECVPEHQTGSAQGISFFTSNILLAAATLASGWLYDSFGAGGFLVMAAIAAAGLCAALAARGLPHPQSVGSGG